MRIFAATYPGRATALLLAIPALAGGMAGCGAGGTKANRAEGSTLTIYTSLPRHGVWARQADAVAAGERLALADAHGRGGRLKVRLVELDDSDPSSGLTWDPSVVEANAKRAAQDPTTIAYIGELSLGGSAISVPVTNSKGILQVSPEDGLTSLTQVQPGGPKTSPARYYPNGKRTFVRLVPTDLEQVRELVASIHEQGGERLAVVHDDRLFGREMAAQAVAAASDWHLAVADVEEARGDADSYVDLARKLASKHADALAYLGVGGPHADLLLKQLADALPGARLYATSGLAGSPLPAGDDLPPVETIDPEFPASAYGPAGARVLRRLATQLGTPVPVDALYGYEAMRLALDAMGSAEPRPNDRDAVADSALAPRTRRSVVGTYSITRTGDVSPSRLASYRLLRGRLEYEGARRPPRG
jgi:branched-chain amino acid transport system substrate-binding protein